MREPPPCEVRRPTGPARLLYDSPHSGRIYPHDLAAGATIEEVRRAEDAYVDELLAPAVNLGVILLTATYARCYIDLNRPADDIDADLLAEPWPVPLHPTEKSARGLGLIRRYVAPGIPVNARKLRVSEVERRLADVYVPYHQALDGLVAELRTRTAPVLHIDWHSMKSAANAMTPDRAGTRRADFVVSDRDGTSASPQVSELIADTLRSLGYSVSVNDPYKGGAIVQRIGRPVSGIHSAQVEINRALYLDELRVEKTAGFGPLQNVLVELTRALVDWLDRELASDSIFRKMESDPNCRG
jgi:N-formylglutamate amidohydrolase